MNLRFHWMLPKGSEIAVATAEATAAYRTRCYEWTSPARLPDTEGWTKPDFGGNVETFLVGAGDNVADEDYVCLDLNRSVVEQGDEPFRQRAACLAVRRHWQDLLRSIGMQHSKNRPFGRYR